MTSQTPTGTLSTELQRDTLMYDELYCDTVVYLDVEDVVNAECDIFSVESADQLVGFTKANGSQD